jgi:hypothetical protein
MIRRILFSVASASLLGVMLVPAANAGEYITTYDDLQRCLQEGNAHAQARGGAANGVTYSCEEVYSVPPGVAGCPDDGSAPDGCAGVYYDLIIYYR